MKTSHLFTLPILKPLKRCVIGSLRSLKASHVSRKNWRDSGGARARSGCAGFSSGLYLVAGSIPALYFDLVTFRFDTAKATQAACQFIRREGGSINIMKLVKLMYLLDRLAIKNLGMPVAGGRYFSMRNGPVTSEVLDLVNSGSLACDSTDLWERFITDRDQHQVGLKSHEAPRDELSDAEMTLIEELWDEHGGRDQWALRDWCHENCEEWSPLENGRLNISLSEIASAVGLSPRVAEELETDAKEHRFIGSLLRRS